MPAELDPTTREFYQESLIVLKEARIPFLVGGAYALQRYTGIERHTKDLDLFVKPADVDAVLRLFSERGARTERAHPHWLAKVYRDDAFLDIIYRSGNGVAEVDDGWFENAVADEVMEVPVGLCPVEEIIWSKAFVMERERFDGADIAHLILNRGGHIEWARLIRRFGSHWPVLLAHLILFRFVYPSEQTLVPDWVLADLSRRLETEPQALSDRERTCQGPLLSRSQYLIDLEKWGFADVRLRPEIHMTPEEIDHWTDAIAIDGQR